MKIITLILLIVFGISSCSHSDSEPLILNGILTGKFVEVRPENNRTTLIFSSDSNQLQEKTIYDGETPVENTYSIRKLENNMIELSNNKADEFSPKVIHYLIVNNNKFEIGNLNPNAPEETIMLFERN